MTDQHEPERRTPPDRGLPTAGRRPARADEPADPPDATPQNVTPQNGTPPDATPPGDGGPPAVAPLPGPARTVVTRPSSLDDDKTTRLPPPPAWPVHPPAAGDEPTVERERPPLLPAAPERADESATGHQTSSGADSRAGSQVARADSLADIEHDEPSGDEPGRDEPGGDEPGRDELGRDEPGRDEPGRDEPGRDELPTSTTSLPPPADDGDETVRLRPPPVIPAGASRAAGRGTSVRPAAEDSGANVPAEPVTRDATPGTGPGEEARGTGPGGEARGTGPGGAAPAAGPAGAVGGVRPGRESRGPGPSPESLESVISEKTPAPSIAGDPSTVLENDLEHTEPAAAGAAASDAKPGPTDAKASDAKASDAKASDAKASDAKTRKLSSAGALILVLLALFGFTLVVQLRSNSADDGLATARQEDLVRILSDLEARDQRLQSEINTLETSRQQLTSGVEGRQAALAEAQKRADELGLLAGTLPGRGTGLRIVIDPRGAKVKASAVLNAVQELRGAGGEVMQIAGANGAAVRIVASTYFVDVDNGGIVVDGRQLTGPWTLLVIGQPQTMQTALQIPGGVVASVNSAGGSVTMEARSMVEVTAVRKATSLQYARPVS